MTRCKIPAILAIAALLASLLMFEPISDVRGNPVLKDQAAAPAIELDDPPEEWLLFAKKCDSAAVVSQLSMWQLHSFEVADLDASMAACVLVAIFATLFAMQLPIAGCFRLQL